LRELSMSGEAGQTGRLREKLASKRKSLNEIARLISQSRSVCIVSLPRAFTYPLIRPTICCVGRLQFLDIGPICMRFVSSNACEL